MASERAVSAFSLTSPIRTERLLLRSYTPDDLDALHAMHSRADVARYVYWEPRTHEETAEVLRQRISLWLRSAVHRQGEIGFIMHPLEQGHGFATEAADAVLQLAFEPLALHRVCGRTDARNLQSANLMRRLGMRQEAHFVHNEIFKGEWGDELVFAILEDEWRGLHLADETFVEPIIRRPLRCRRANPSPVPE